MPKYATNIHIVSARRSPIGRFGGSLRSVDAVDLATQVCAAVLDPRLVPDVDGVILGQVLQAGVGMNAARQVGLRLGVRHSAPAYTVNMVCGSGLKAIALAADALEQGDASLVLAGGVESMSNAPHYAKAARWGRKLGDCQLLDAITADGLTDPTLNIAMGETAERIAQSFGITREQQDRYALRSQQRAAAAKGPFAREIAAVRAGEMTVTEDEHPRADTTLEKLAKLKSAFGGSITAGNASGINDGAAGVLLADEAGLKRHRLQSRARIIASYAVGCDPAAMGLGPIGAIQGVCERAGWKLGDVDAVEINEAFAAQVLACQSELKLSDAQLNPRGGGIALGHPIGCSGARILVTLLHFLEDTGLKRGVASLCVGGGMGIAMAIQRD